LFIGHRSHLQQSHVITTEHEISIHPLSLQVRGACHGLIWRIRTSKYHHGTSSHGRQRLCEVDQSAKWHSPQDHAGFF
jgi:hypothetical protein